MTILSWKMVYRITPTERGDYIVRNQADRQLARFATLNLAESDVAARKTVDAGKSAANKINADKLQNFIAENPELEFAMHDWQERRNDLFGELHSIAKQLAGLLRKAQRIGFGRCDGQVEDAQRRMNELQNRYERYVSLDGAIKRAMYSVDAPTWGLALREAAKFMSEVKNDRL